MSDTSGRGEAPAHLFVYGTLMSRARGLMGEGQRKRLGRHATSLGEATIAGRLIDLGDYPGLLAPETPEDVVHGELFRLDRADEVLPWLDEYEGVSPVPSPNDDYVRVPVTARLTSGETLSAWVYRYQLPPSGFALIPSGRWQG
jgi:gamma-glutamylcyclotransferase (GGCT)/AIG2-like uncharacterized protein YtfP